ncbi:MAG TPA: DUF1501 domain-containing protein [Pirellulales bacterium]|jgi:hypothetical protein|nr:DUF1501 domain-containing protein [Pirellulales bacterium]
MSPAPVGNGSRIGDSRIGGTRRDFLRNLGGGFGAVALASLFGQAGALADTPRAEWNGGLHFPAKARRVIQLFMNGGASQADLFDYKPELVRRHGKPFDPGDGAHVEAATSTPGNVLKPPFPLKQHGQCGRWISDQLPHLAKCVDDLAFFMAMSSRTNVHGPGSYLMNTGFLLPGFPCMGSWISYALGNLTDELPAFVVLTDPRGLPYNGKGNFSSGFLPVTHQGTVIQSATKEPIPDLFAPPSARFITPAAERDGLALLAKINREHAAANDGDGVLEARIQSYELAARMQLSAPAAFDLTQETAQTHALYGLDEPTTSDFGRRCLLARRLVERGVRFVQLWSGPGGPVNNWDNHGSIFKELPPMCASTDKPIAALLVDLKQRGLLDDTLLLWNTEFGRMPFSQGSDGRDHNGGTFVGWMAGAGVRAGTSYGESDPWSWKAVRDVTTTYDFHATVLHLLGIDHKRLTVRHNGANRRLTDVHGNVIDALLA